MQAASIREDARRLGTAAVARPSRHRLPTPVAVGAVVAAALAATTLLGLADFSPDRIATDAMPRWMPLALLLAAAAIAVLSGRLTRPRGSRPHEARNRLLTSALAFVLTGALIALAGTRVMVESHRSALLDQLQQQRDALRIQLDAAIASHAAQVAALAVSPQVVGLFATGTAPPQPNNSAAAAIAALQPLAYAITDTNGAIMAAGGGPLPESGGIVLRERPGMRTALARAADGAELVLRMQAPVRQGGIDAGALAIDFPLPATLDLLQALQRELPGTAVRLCALAESGGTGCVDALPGHDGVAQVHPHTVADALAAQGRSATTVETDGTATRALSYAPVGGTGAGIVVSTPAATLFAPVVGEARSVTLLAPLAILLGLLAFAWPLRPLLRDATRQRNMFKTAFDHSGIGIELLDGDGCILDCNPALAHMLGYTRQELLDQHDIYALIADGQRDAARANIREMACNDAGPYCTERPYRHKDGSYRTLRWHVSPIHDEAGNVQMIASFGVDATESIAQRERLVFQSAFLRAVLEDLQDVVYAVDARGMLIYANRAANRAGIPPRMALSLPELARLSPLCDAEARSVPVDAQPLPRAMRGETVREEEFQIRAGDGAWLQYQISAYPLRDAAGVPLGAVGVAHDVSPMRATERHLRWLIEHDELTRLPNRLRARDRLAELLAHAGPADEQVMLVLIDIDRFKHINDSFGHAYGDRLLQAIAERLGAKIGGDGEVFRFGSDEFLIAAIRRPGEHEAGLASRALRIFDQPFDVGDRALFVAATAGIACGPDDGDTPDALFAHVDSATFRAKRVAPGHALRYRPDMDGRGREHVELETELRSALTDEQFVIHYQPKICLKSGALIGAEALLRWQHPVRGLVPPGDFIPLLEETGLIVPVGAWLLRAVCAQQQQWRRAGKALVPVAVNCSARQLQGDLILRQLRQALEATGTAPGLIEIEITESMMLQDPDHVSALLAELRDLGVKTSIDDFGTGYSSLATLKRLPVATLKLDRAFVKDLPTDTDDAAITRAVLSMAEALHLDVIAEGVETAEQVAFLGGLGCSAYQGFLFSPAVPPDRFDRFLS